MSERALGAVLGVAALLLGVYLVVSWTGDEESEAPGDDPVSAALVGLADSTVRAVRIRRPDLTLDLVREGERWRANEFDADSAAVAHLFRTLGESRVTEMVSRNPDNHPSLGVTADSAWSVRFVTDGDSTARILVGERGPYDPSAYVRLVGDDRAYVLRGQLRSVLSGAMVQWRDKTVAAVDTGTVAEVRVRRPGGAYRLRRDSAGWILDDGEGAVDAGAVDGLLAGLARLEGFAFAGGDTEMGPAVREVVALDASGDTLAWVRAAPSGTGESWLARSSRGKGALFRVAPGPVEEVTPPRDSLATRAGGR